MEALNIMMTNCENTNCTTESAANAQKSEPLESFRLVLNQQNINHQGENVKAAANAESKSTDKTFLLLNLLSESAAGDKLKNNLKIAGLGEENTQDSRCGDSEMEELIDGIVGILEGFGLLDYNMDESVIDELANVIGKINIEQMPLKESADGIQQMVINTQGAAEGKVLQLDENIQNDIGIDMLSKIIARMPNSDQYEPIMQEAAEKIQKLIDEYQCSFDNTNKTGVKNFKLNQEPKKTQEASTAADKIKLMIKEAVGKSGGSKAKPIGDEKGMEADSGKANEHSAKANESVYGFTQSVEVSKNTNNQQLENIEHAANENMAENVARIADKITSQRTENGDREFDVTLKPGFLGKLSIKLVMDGDEIKAHIKSADQFVKGLISEQLPELTQALKDRGVNMTNIEVVYDGPMFTSTEQQFSSQQDMGSPKRGMRAAMTSLNEVENTVFDTQPTLADLYLKNSSVEFSA